MSVNLTRISTRQERAMLQSFNTILSDIRNNVVLSEIVRAMETGNVDAVIELLQLDRATWEPMEHALREAYREGGITGSTQVGKVPTTDGTLVMRFDVRNPRAERWLSVNSSRLITEIVNDQREMVRTVLTANIEQGINPRTAALDLVGRIDPITRSRAGGFIGMTDKQAKWVTNARNELNTLDPNYLTRALRDRRLDGAFKRAVKSGEPLTQRQIDVAITRMQGRTQRYRGQVIARTESINALRAGQHESINQAIGTGELDQRDAMKSWDATGDQNTREDHLMMGSQPPIPFDQPFIAPDESQLMYPGDTSLGATAEQVIQCRCRERIQIDFAGQLKRIEGFR